MVLFIGRQWSISATAHATLRGICRTSAAAAALTVLAACGGESDSVGTEPPPTPAPIPGTLFITAEPNSVSVVAGTATTIDILISRGGSFTGAVGLNVQGLPAGVVPSFVPTIVPAGAMTATLTLGVAPSVNATRTSFLLAASGSGVSGMTRIVSLEVIERGPGDFSFTLDPASVTLTAGQSVNSTVNIVRTGGFSGAVSLSVEGLPNGITGEFNPATVTGDQAQLTLTASGAVPAGAFTAVVRGAGVGLGAHTASLAVSLQSGGGGGG